MPIQSRIDSTHPPVRLWLPIEEVEQGAIDQLTNAASLPFVKQVCAMPDVHFGFGVPIGSVVACRGAISPMMCGVDIGCGMSAMEVDIDPDRVVAEADKLRHSIERSVPTGFHQHKEDLDHLLSFNRPLCADKAGIEDQRVQLQLGTLGGGNHFIEVCLDENRAVWVMIHTGSRNSGLKVANYYTKLAKALMEQYLIKLPDPNLAYLPLGTQEYHDYWEDLLWVQSYALENRKRILQLIKKDIMYFVGGEHAGMFGEPIDCHHNYAAMENHGGQNHVIVRKGAISAKAGEVGIIPGSMGAKSFIVEGLGNPESFNSCSHGAGRKMGRNVAKKTFTKEDLAKSMVGISYNADADIIDEIAGAYKDVDKVMEYQTDLVKPVHTLKQILSIKGDKD